MVTASITKDKDGTLHILARFEDEESGITGDGYADLSPGGGFLDIGYPAWAEHVGELVTVQEDGTLVTTPTR